MILAFVVLLVAFRMVILFTEAWYERDWPRDTWKGLLLACALLLFGLSAFGQNTRWDAQSTTTTGSGQMLPVLALPGSQVAFYTGCTVLPCTTPAVTYQSATSATACPSNAQVVWQLPVGGGCQSTSDAQGNFGGWFQPGAYQYVVQVSGIVAGPYYFTIAGGGGGGGAFLPLVGGTLSGTLYAPNVDGEVYPASCGFVPSPAWCSGTTADAWIRAACTQLPASGGIMNLLGLRGTIAASATCSTPTKQVIMLADITTSNLTITEADGGIAFPLDNGSMLVGQAGGSPGNCPTNNGIHLASTANVTAIVGNVHTDGTQENITASGLCLYGATGATVSQGLMYANHVFANTIFEGNVVGECNTACAKILNTGEMNLVNNWFNVEDGNTAINGTPLIIQGQGLGNGCNVGPVNVSGGQIEHALGGSPEILIEGDGTGLTLGCDIHIHDLGIERSPAGTASTVGINISDCKNCSVENVLATGVSSSAQSMIQLNSNFANSITNVVLRNISDIFGTYPTVLNDTTTFGISIPFVSQPFITAYYSNPGYVQPPVLPLTTLQALGSDAMAGAGDFSTGSGTIGTGFVSTGCNAGVTCTYTRTNSTAPPGLTYSQEIQITANTDPSSGFNGVQYGTTTPVSFTAGQTYAGSFWAKGDGTFAGYATFLLWNSLVPTYYCQGTSNTPLTTTWTAYSFLCTPTTSGSSNLAIAAATPIGGTTGSTGTFYLGGFSFAPVTALQPGGLLSAIAPYGIGPASAAQQTITINGTSCQLSGSCTVSSVGGGVSSINGTPGAYTFSFSGGAGSCSGTTCTFTGAGTGGGSVTNFIANTGSWPTWLVPSVATSTTTPTLSVSASSIPNSALANAGLTLGSTALNLGGTTTTVNGLTLGSPTLTTPALGTPSAVVLTNGTGLPWTGLTGTPSTSQVPVQLLTTTGTFGPATLLAGVLNIPQYAGTTTTICSGTIALGTAAIPAGASAAPITATCTGLASTDTVMMDFNQSPLTIVGYQASTSGMLTIIKWPSSNTINVSVVNNTAASITPGAVTLNYRVVR